MELRLPTTAIENHQKSISLPELSKSKNSSSDFWSRRLFDYLPKRNFSFHLAEPIGQPPNSATSDLEQRATVCLSNATNNRKLLILLGWMYARERHLEKYRRFYLELGFDVLTVKTHSLDALMPVTRHGVINNAHRLIQFLDENLRRYAGLLIHMFSVGGFIFGELLVQLEHSPLLKNSFEIKLRGLIFESVVDMHECANGLARATTKNRLLRWMISSLTQTILSQAPWKKNYFLASVQIRFNDLNCPRLVLCSRDDPIATYETQKEAIHEWRHLGKQVTMKCWRQSPHVGHFVKHNAEYRKVLNKFLEEIFV